MLEQSLVPLSIDDWGVAGQGPSWEWWYKVIEILEIRPGLLHTDCKRKKSFWEPCVTGDGRGTCMLEVSGHASHAQRQYCACEDPP